MSAIGLMLALFNCAAFEQPDQRAYCQAFEQLNSGQCYAIRDAELRTQCRAEVLGESNLCYSIVNADERTACQMRANRRHPSLRLH